MSTGQCGARQPRRGALEGCALAVLGLGGFGLGAASSANRIDPHGQNFFLKTKNFRGLQLRDLADVVSRWVRLQAGRQRADNCLYSLRLYRVSSRQWKGQLVPLLNCSRRGLIVSVSRAK